MSRRARWFGVIPLAKPAGWTSRRVVDVVARLVRPAKAGHAGTLDPLATGVLVIALGPATRLIDSIQQMPKEYRGTFLLGRRSPSEDVDTEVEVLPDPPRPTADAVRQAAAALVGESLQRPPAYSALKVAGERAYRLARKGADVQLAPRPVTVYDLDVVRYDYPELELTARVSAGTYLRSLGRDLAESLGTAAVMSALVRTAVGPFRLDSAIPALGLSRATLLEGLLPPHRALGTVPQVAVEGADLDTLRNGHNILVPDTAAPILAAVNATGQLVAVLERREPAGWYHPSRTFFHVADES